ncbi:MAG: RNA 2',3'-cyclic phosphodiesterase [Candidatus Micrarchaeota archaeon]|nr:RNA 2',3'-cyclic phosphodiesterase [Candidatus Micrarchaeota archaeon]
MRCFIAAEISDKVRTAISSIMRSADDSTLKMVDSGIMHITLKFLGEIGGDDADMCKRILDECAGHPIPLRFSGGGAFPSPYAARVIYVGATSPGLVQLAECIRKRTAQYGDNKPFVCHVTVARARHRPVNATKLVEKLNAINFDDEVRTISIKKSTLTPTGPVYEDIYVKKLA